MNLKGQEVSGYLDLGDRLRSEDFEVYFDRKKRLLPRPTDLSFFNWTTHYATCNESSSFQVIPDHDLGLLFKSKKDRMVINVDPRLESPGEGSSRHEVETCEYAQVVIFDHMSSKKTMEN